MVGVYAFCHCLIAVFCLSVAVAIVRSTALGQAEDAQLRPPPAETPRIPVRVTGGWDGEGTPRARPVVPRGSAKTRVARPRVRASPAAGQRLPRRQKLACDPRQLPALVEGSLP